MCGKGCTFSSAEGISGPFLFDCMLSALPTVNCFPTKRIKVLACLISDRDPPQFLWHISGRLRQFASDSKHGPTLSPAVTLFPIMTRLLKLHIRTKSCSDRQLSQIVASAIESDDALEDWANGLPTSWSYHKSSSGPSHVYASPWVAKIWNYYRLCRILSNQMIIGGIDGLPKPPRVPIAIPREIDPDLLHSRSYSIIQMMRQEIYASFHFIFYFQHADRGYSLPFSADIFFAIIILQTLIKLGDSALVAHSWLSPICEIPGKGFAITKEIVLRHIQ